MKKELEKIMMRVLYFGLALMIGIALINSILNFIFYY